MNKLAKAALATSALFAVSTTAALAQSPTPPSGTTKFEIITPSDDQIIYGDKIPVLFSTENFSIVDYNQNPKATPGQGHIHLWLDKETPTAQDAIKVITDVHTMPDIQYGEHTLKAELVTNDHKPLNPPQVLTIKFINQQIASDPSSQTEAGFDKKTAAVIFVVVALVIIAAWYYTKDEDEELSEDSPNKKPTKKKSRPKKHK